MKYVALALALLLAIGSQAASLQADAPTQLDHIRSAVGLYLGQVKESAVRSLDHLDDTEYRHLKANLRESLDDLERQLQQAQAAAAPYTNTFFEQVMESTHAARDAITTDLDNLRTELAPKREVLRDVIGRHLEEYRSKLEPIIEEYTTRQKAEMDLLKAQLEPVVEELRTKVAINVEETKTALMPIVESVRAKLIERLEGLREMATPYVEEYKEQLTKAIGEVRERAGALNTEELQSQVAPHLASLREKAGPLAEEAKAKLMELYQAISVALSQN